MTLAERKHVETLSMSRPDWDVMAISPLFSDEQHGKEADHVYTKVHPYLRGMASVLKLLATYRPSHVLDIGSPLAQNVAVDALTSLTMVDVREHRDLSLGLKCVVGTACDLPIPTASQEMVTSLWVMCHVGDGRYGDTLEPEGDVKMLQEIYRVLRPEGVAALGVGPLSEKCRILFNAHRLYSWKWLSRVFKEIGFSVLLKEEYPVSRDMFFHPHWESGVSIVTEREDGMYGYVVLRKPNGH